MKKIAALLFLISPSLFAFNESERLLVHRVIKVLLAANLPIIAGQQSLELDQASRLLLKISEDAQAIQQLLTVRDDFYTSDGQVFRDIIVAAAKDRTERDALIAGIRYEKCQKWFWQCGLPPISWNKIRFKFFSKLKSNLDALEQTIAQLGNLPGDDYADFDPRSLDPYESYFQLFALLEADLESFLPSLFEFYTDKSLQTLTAEELRKLLKKLILFLNDNENGVLGFIRKSRPRN